MSRVDYEYEFDPAQQNNTAASVYRLAAHGGTRILDLGSGPGIVSGYLATVDGKSVTCVDSDPQLLAAAKGRGVQRTIVADLNDDSWIDELPSEQFDVVILADVLEHLYDPGRLLSSLNDSSLIASDGRLVISVPNAAHEGALAELVSGHFTYTPTGILDETHIRFFTLNSLRTLVESAGFIITHIDRTERTIEQTSFRDRLPDIPAGLRQMLAEHNPEVRVFQYVMQLVPAHEREVIAEARVERDALKAEVAKREIELSAARGDLVEANASAEAHMTAVRELEVVSRDLEVTRIELESERHRATSLYVELHRVRSTQIRRLVEVDSKRIVLSQDLQKAKSRQRELETQIRSLERRIDMIYASNTWRAGERLRRLVTPFRRKPSGTAEPSKPERPRTDLPADLHRRPPELTKHPLADEYVSEVSSVVPTSGTSIAFAVYTTGFDEGRGDVFVAAGLGRYLRRLGLSSIYVPEQFWYDVSEGVDWLIAMLPTYRPSRAPKGTRVIGWIRNEVDNWLDHPELDLFDALLCSSDVIRATISERFGGLTGVVPIAVDMELFAPVEEPTKRLGVVSTVNQWGRERDVYKALRTSSIEFPLDIYGKAVGLSGELAGFHRGLVDFFSLPGVYRGAQIVLDDFNHTTVGWGAVNSRIFEAIAAGALPITNSSLGLEQLGLEAVPVVTDPSELNPKVESLLAERETIEGTVESLRRVVRERHSFERRAHEFASYLSEANGIPNVRRVLGFFPDYQANNPFQAMLYASRHEHSTAVMPLDRIADINASIPERSSADRIFHLHWTAPITGLAETEAEALARVDEFLASVERFRGAGGRFVWTIHNAMPHEVRFDEIELHLRNELAMRADLIHVMCDATFSVVEELYRLPVDRTVVIPHSGYVGVYPDAADRGIARMNLGLETDEIALLALGGIRLYKRIDKLLDALDKARELQPRLRLVVAGKPGRFPEIRELQERCESHPAVISNFNEIASSDLQYFYKAADVAVLAHGAALNSGALFLAYSFGLPVIAPRLGCLDESLAEAASIGFDPSVDASLIDALAGSERLCSEDARRAARAFAESRPIADMSGAFMKALDELGG